MTSCHVGFLSPSPIPYGSSRPWASQFACSGVAGEASGSAGPAGPRALWPTKSIYRESVKDGPIWTGLVGSLANWVSPTMRNVLACRSRDGDTPGGRDVESVSPEAVMASCIKGMSRSIRASRLLISLTIRFNWNWCRSACRALSPASRAPSSSAAAFSSRLPRATISRCSDLARGTADSRKTLPRPDLC